MPFAVLADTGADLPGQPGIALAPLHYQLDNEAYEPGHAADLSGLYFALRNGAEVKTIPALPEAFAALWEPHLQAGWDILQLTIAQALSNTMHAALSAREALLPRYPGRRIVVIDSCSVAVLEGMLAFEAAEMCREGKSLDAAAEWLVKNRRHLNGLLLPADPTRLKNTGLLRSGGLRGLLKSTPVLRMTAKGTLEVFDQAKSPEDGLLALAEEVKRTGYALGDQVVSVTHGDDPALAEALVSTLREVAGCREIMTLPLGPIAACYAGAGALGVAYFGAGR